MRNRIVAAWKVLRGEWRAIPCDTEPMNAFLYVPQGTATNVDVSWTWGRTG